MKSADNRTSEKLRSEETTATTAKVTTAIPTTTRKNYAENSSGNDM